ncbi:MAG: hypothetical protein KA250_04610 [Verrucomicrobiales bacterium]|nr:hypothetical protein [Verrucomicrobiales bacterium]MBP9222339.1 hypothetical protein [Verrucomicrobiales bacterium]HQZ29437.1 hypothetical protein [Verrucomicrobiales bacterium]
MSRKYSPDSGASHASNDRFQQPFPPLLPRRKIRQWEEVLSLAKANGSVKGKSMVKRLIST